MAGFGYNGASVAPSNGRSPYGATPSHAIGVIEMKGFTLIEILFTIGVVGLLASTVFFTLSNTHTNSKKAKARADLRELQKAILLMEEDTGSWPAGCPPGRQVNPPSSSAGQEIYLDTDWAGLLQKPPLGEAPVPMGTSISQPIGNGNVSSFAGGCGWVQADLDAWRGPYIQQVPTDPWGKRYYYDSDLELVPGSYLEQGIMSFGPNGVKEYPSGDDIVLMLTDQSKNK